MNGKNKRVISFVLLIVIVILNVFTLISCAKDREYDEQTVLAEAEKLIKASVILNDIYYGQGIPFIKNEAYADGVYYMADGVYLDAKGINTVDDIKRMTESVFSKKLSGIMISSTLSSIYEGEQIKIYSRYYQSYDPLTDEPLSIMVYKDAKIILEDSIAYDYTTLCVLGSEKQRVYVQIDATVTTKDNKSCTNKLKIALIEEENGWRLATPSYTSYVDMDYYNDLQNK